MFNVFVVFGWQRYKENLKPQNHARYILNKLKKIWLFQKFIIVLQLICMEEVYNSYSQWIRKQFPFRVQKISVDAGFTCPNRDGRVGSHGCIFCDNETFNPSYCDRNKSIATQLEEGKRFFSRKYPDMKYLAYFQAYSNTYDSLDHLKRKYEEALAVEDVVGLVIGTRPDCMPDNVLAYLESLSRQSFLIVEYGIESANDNTLQLIHRGHTFEVARQSIERTAGRGILTGAHVILGLPGEDATESIRQADVISSLPLHLLKLHQLQVIRGTALARMYNEKPFHLYSIEEYISLVSCYLQRLRKDIVVERFVSQSPHDKVLAPHWGIKNYEFTNLLTNYMKKNEMYQGKMFNGGKNC